MLFPALSDPSDKPAIRFPERTLSYRALRDASAAVAARVEGAERVAVWASPAPETCVGVIGALLAGVPAVPINPKSGERELAHIVSDSAPELVLSAPGADLPEGVATLPRTWTSARTSGGGGGWERRRAVRRRAAIKEPQC